MQLCLNESRELLTPKITKFSGNYDEDPAKWLKEIVNFAESNSFDLLSTFDFLLEGDAKDLWLAFKSRQNVNDKMASDWFKGKFIKEKSFLRIIEECSGIRQKENERFENFELRVLRSVKEIFESGLTVEEIAQQIIKKRVSSEELRKSFALKPEIKPDEMRKLAENFEKNDESFDGSQINKLTYSEVAPANFRPKIKKIDSKSSSFYKPRNNEMEKAVPIAEEFNDHRNSRENYHYKNTPTVSMKFIARKLYNRSKGLPPPKEEQLTKGSCFCCGLTSHIRSSYPLKSCCLICGKTGHSFRNCRLLGNPMNYNNNCVRCILEEDESAEKRNKDFKLVNHDISYLNKRDSVVSILLVDPIK